MRRLALAALFIGCLPTVARAQPLGDRIPADAIVYVGWRGASSLGPEYERSHTKAVVEASNFPQLFSQFLPDLIRKVRTKDRDAADKLDTLAAVGGPLWRYPSALYIGPVDTSNPQQPKPRLALLCDAGEEAPQVAGRFKTLLDKVDDSPFPITVTTQGSTVVVASFDLPAKPEAVLPGSKSFADALAQAHNDPAFAAYVDAEAGIQLIDMLVTAGGDAEAIRNWPLVRQLSGLEGVKRLVWTCAFEGPDVGSRAFLEAPSPRKGILALFDNQPLPEELLKTIPRSTTLLAAGGFDLSRVLAEARTVVKAVDADASANLEKGLSAGSMMVGVNLEKDLIDAIGSHWALYCAPTVGGSGLLGLTLVNRLDDPAKAERSLGMVEMFANNMIAMQMRKQKDPPRIAFRQSKIDGMTVHFLPVPFVSPSWGVKGQNLYVSLFPQVLSTAARQADAPDSILDSESFKAARARVPGADKASSVQFLDLPAVGAEGYASVVAMTQLGLGAADMLGVPAPPMVLPALDKLRPHFAPALAVTRVDERGVYYHKIAPFPGAENFGPQNQAFIGQNAMMISILLPSLNRARETANRVKCAGNLRQIGLAALLYGNENKNRHAPNLGELLRTQDVSIDVFVCPSSNNAIPAAVRAGDVDAKVAWVNEHASYVWAGAGKNNTMPADQVLAYEHMHNHDSDGINVLFGDGHVEFLLRDGAIQLLEGQGLKWTEGE